MSDRTEETLHAAAISLLAEAVSVSLFLFMLFVWFAIIGTSP